MKMLDIDLPVIYLMPSEMYVAQEPALVQTVLGSCVSVTMYDRKSGNGMICHGLLPQCRDSRSCSRTCAEEHKYMECSIHRMLERFDSLNIRRRDIEVKVFGGADMFASWKSMSVGKQNIETAMKIIKNEGLNVSASDVGGTKGRKIYFYTHTGEVLLKRLK
jgi:chemotaxis protein CheD